VSNVAAVLVVGTLLCLVAVEADVHLTLEQLTFLVFRYIVTD